MNKFDRYIKGFEENIHSEIIGLVAWVKEYVDSAGARGCILGMSGGVDCSCVAALLHKVGIPVLLVKMPYGESMQFAGDNGDADNLIEKFGFNSMTVDITKSVDMIVKNIEECNVYTCDTSSDANAKWFTGKDKKLTDMSIANIKPRVRMSTLYAIGQKMGYLVVGTGNLSESNMGYTTKFGDSACDFNPIAKYTKTEVRLLAKHLGVPERIIAKAPSANLWEGQTDEDEMGVTYYDIDQYLTTGEGNSSVVAKIQTAQAKSKHKRDGIPVYDRNMNE